MTMEKAKVEHQNVLDERFVKVTNEFREYLQVVKDRFDQFDLQNREEPKRIDFVKKEKEEIFKKLDGYFHASWEIVKDFDKDKYKINQRYYYENLAPLFGESAINMRIRNKPFGYDGDYIIMNYIYDNSADNYLGQYSFERIINNYTCNIPFSISNIMRKDFIKKSILQVIDKKQNAKILSVGGGPARELLELLDKGRIKNNFNYNYLDFEKDAMKYVKDQLKAIDEIKKKPVAVNYFLNNVIDIIRNKTLGEALANQDLIYVLGVFDYLKDSLATKLIKQLFNLLNKNGTLMVCNASLEHCSHRAYFETLGDWNMFYRSQEEMLSWTSTFSNLAEIKFENPREASSYLFLNIKKL